MTNSGRKLVQIETRTPPTILKDRLQVGTPASLLVNPDDLRERLEGRIKGEVRFAEGDRGMYASDASNYRMVPLGVILPRDADDVEHAVSICREAGVPIHARGGGTGIPGQ